MYSGTTIQSLPLQYFYPLSIDKPVPSFSMLLFLSLNVQKFFLGPEGQIFHYSSNAYRISPAKPTNNHHITIKFPISNILSHAYALVHTFSILLFIFHTFVYRLKSLPLRRLKALLGHKIFSSPISSNAFFPTIQKNSAVNSISETFSYLEQSFPISGESYLPLFHSSICLSKDISASCLFLEKIIITTSKLVVCSDPIRGSTC